MERTRVVVLSSRSLYAEGVISRLRQHEDHLELIVVDSHQTDAMEKIKLAQPTAVILDASDQEANNHCPLEQLLQSMPAVKVIRLDPSQDGFQVLTSERHTTGELGDLISILNHE
jgi:DNA-binding NarL/FixJ family response regulator